MVKRSHRSGSKLLAVRQAAASLGTDRGSTSDLSAFSGETSATRTPPLPVSGPRSAFLVTVHKLHERGYRRIRIMPSWSPAEPRTAGARINTITGT
jgi:hypothetical protein